MAAVDGRCRGNLDKLVLLERGVGFSADPQRIPRGDRPNHNHAIGLLQLQLYVAPIVIASVQAPVPPYRIARSRKAVGDLMRRMMIAMRIG